jgi:hypothetical protein
MEKAIPFIILVTAGAAYLYFTNKKEYFTAVPATAALPAATEQTLPVTAPRLPQDPSTSKQTPTARLATFAETLTVFLQKEGVHLQSTSSDPTILLPLQRAFADKDKLQKELAVIKRNPSAPMGITIGELYDMEMNLQYLRKLAAALKNVEGFADMPTGPRATPQELSDFKSRLSAEIIRLQASGTTDPVIAARIKALQSLKQEIDKYITDLQSGLLKPQEVPVYQTDIINSLPILGKPSEPLPQIIKMANLPVGLTNILPAQDTQDPASRQEYADLINKYADTVLNGLSWSIAGTLKYTAPNEVSAAQAVSASNNLASFNMNSIDGNSTVSTTGFPSMGDLTNVSQKHQEQQQLIGNEPIVNDMYSMNPAEGGRAPGQFDWRGLAVHITDQIRKRGMNPADFGALNIEGVQTAPGGSWRGYTHMICSRLNTTMDPGLPEMCGCPPEKWRGWGLPRW